MLFYLKPNKEFTSLNYRVLFTLLFLLMFFTRGAAQDKPLTGTVINGETNKPVAYAHVRLGGKATYTNEDGRFVLNASASENTYNKLEVFQMGFDPFRAGVQTDQPYRIILYPLTPTGTETDSLTGTEIMQEVFLRFFTNYEYKDQLTTSYYREKLTGNGEMYYFADEVLNLYLPTNIINAPPLVRPLKSRIRYLLAYPHKSVNMSAGGPVEMIQSSIRANNSFLASGNRWDYTYKLSGSEMHRNEKVYVIDFEPANGKGYLAGRIYVDQYLYAIVKLDYYYVKDEGKKWTEEFEHIDYNYYLFRTSYEDRWLVDGKTFVFHSMLINTEIVPDQEDNIEWEEFVTGKNYMPDEVMSGAFNEDFYDPYNYLPLTGEEKAKLQQNSGADSER